MGRIADVWAYAFTRAIGMPNEALDRERINEAFLGAVSELKKWPAPAEIIERMPKRVMPQLANDPPPADPEKVKSFMNLLNKRLEGEITQEELEEGSRNG